MKSLKGRIGEVMMTKMLQKKPIKIKCPHCMQETQHAWICEMDSVIGLRYAYICSNCEKLLGISSQKDSPLFTSSREREMKNNL
jgi:DNA-directed RNA polymerase subunit RPC12/RpoP